MKKITLILIAALASNGLLLSACHHDTAKKYTSTTIQLEPFSNTLYFSGYIQPLSAAPVISPIAGSVSKMNFQFGDIIKKDQLLYEISAATGQSDVQSALASFLKAKDQLASSKQKADTSEILNKDGLMSRNDYQNDLDAYYSNNLAFFQAKEALDITLAPYRDVPDVYSLSISDTKKVRDILLAINQQKAIAVTSAAEGVALQSSSSSSNSEDGSSSSATVGASVKTGQVLVNIGEMSGLSINIAVDEINIEQLKIKQPATVTTDALPNLSLKGYVSSISQQASNSDALPTFAVSIIVPQLSAQEKQLLRFGMSAKVAIEIKHAAQIMVPINAVAIDKGQTIVKLSNGQIAPVVTGKTTQGEVVILSGLKAGDTILVPN